jgi:hypothetical protein
MAFSTRSSRYWLPHRRSWQEEEGEGGEEGVGMRRRGIWITSRRGMWMTMRRRWKRRW